MNHAEIPSEPLEDCSFEKLTSEVERYLEAVAVFRALGCEPRWRSDSEVPSRVVTLIAPYIDHVSPV